MKQAFSFFLSENHRPRNFQKELQMARGTISKTRLVRYDGTMRLCTYDLFVVPGAGFEPAASGPNAFQIMSFVPLAWLALYQLSHPGPEQKPSD